MSRPSEVGFSLNSVLYHSTSDLFPNVKYISIKLVNIYTETESTSGEEQTQIIINNTLQCGSDQSQSNIYYDAIETIMY